MSGGVRLLPWLKFEQLRLCLMVRHRPLAPIIGVRFPEPQSGGEKMKRYIEIEFPEECPYRQDVSNYPGGDMRCTCEWAERSNMKCEDDHRFPKKCPLKKSI